MSDITVTTPEGALAIEFDEGLYPKDAIYGAAYTFIDRCYMHLDRPSDGKVRVTFRAKSGEALDTAALAGQFENELLGQAWRRSIVEENRAYIESITTRAIAGAAGAPGLDELLDTDIGEESAFDDPLGIAMSWEDKYKKKKAPVTEDPASSSTPDEAGEKA